MTFTPPAWATAKIAVKGIWAAMVGLLVITSVAVAVVMSIRTDGFKVLWVEWEGWKPKAERLEAELTALKKASVEAALAQKKVLDAQERRYAEIAKEIDENAQAEIDAAHADAERYIRANRVRAENLRCPSFGPAAPATGGSSGDGEEVREAPVLDAPETVRVAVLPEDIRICTANTLQAEAARKWALDIEEENNDSNP